MSDMFDGSNLSFVIRTNRQYWVPANTTMLYDINQGYQGYCSPQSEISVTGYRVDPAELMLEIIEPTNTAGVRVPYPFRDERSVKDALWSLYVEDVSKIETVAGDNGVFVATVDDDETWMLQPNETYTITVSEALSVNYNVTNPTLPPLAMKNSTNLKLKNSTKEMLFDSNPVAEHFNFNKTGNWYSVIFRDSYDGILTEGDEIAVFDGDLCVGAEVYDGEMPFKVTTSLKVSFNEETVLNGAVSGNEILVKIWDKETDVLYVAELFAEKEAEYFFGGSYYSNIIIDNATSLQEESALPIKTELMGNYPNPFNPSTTIKYALANEGMVKMQIFNINGQLVETLVNEVKTPGYYDFIWDGSSVSSGLYIYRFEADGITDVQKMILLK
jgi:hypothetical protein